MKKIKLGSLRYHFKEYLEENKPNLLWTELEEAWLRFLEKKGYIKILKEL